MARRVFFSFYYQRDIWRVNQVRNSWLTHPNREVAGYWDASLWEKTELKGKTAIERLIDEGLENTSVTAVLIGAETADRDYVRYEIEQSLERKNGLLGVYIHGLRDRSGSTDRQGENPYSKVVKIQEGKRIPLAVSVPVFDWVLDKGYENFGAWVDQAAKVAGR
jgi:hypothetical protein